MIARTGVSGWSFVPSSFALAGDVIHVWLVPMDNAHDSVPSCEKLLSSDERERAGRFKFVRDRNRYIVAHAALRWILAAYLRLNPLDFRFLLGPRGKPRLESGRLTFNLTHSHEVALIAVTQSREVGVDVEWVSQDFAFDEVAERFFTPSEVAALAALPRQLQRQAFYKCWTSKEAYLKAKGTGLSGELDEVEIVRGQDEVVRIEGGVPNWTLTELSSIEGYEAALVVEGHKAPLEYCLWEPQEAPSPHSRS